MEKMYFKHIVSPCVQSGYLFMVMERGTESCLL